MISVWSAIVVSFLVGFVLALIPVGLVTGLGQIRSVAGVSADFR